MSATKQENPSPPAGTGTPPRQSLDLDAEKQNVIHNESLDDAPAPEEDHIEAKRVLRKIDWRLVPLLNFLYFLTFLDRVNIGNARLWNLERDLGMVGTDYNIAILVFYVPVILFEIPSNMMLSRIQPRYWISGLVFGFGMTVTMAGFCHNFASLIATRVLIGAFEAGMLPGCLYMLSCWYKRHELLTRVAIFMLATDIAGALSGLLGAGIGSLDGTGGYSGWSWIFFIEGGFTVLGSVISFFFLPPFPEDSTFLEPAEKEWLLRRLREDTKGGPLDKKMGMKASLQALLDWKVWAAAALYLGVCVTGYAIAVFQPTILSTFGWDGVKGNLLTAPVRVAAGIASVVIGIWSDRVKRRGTLCISGFSISIVGSIIVMSIPQHGIRYFGLYVAAVGIYMCQPLVLAWGTNQVVGRAKRGIVSAVAVATGQFGGIITAMAFPKSDAPMYVTGMSTCIAFAAVGIIAATTLWTYGSWENKQREAGKRDHLRALPEEEQQLLGEKHPDFRFTP